MYTSASSLCWWCLYIGQKHIYYKKNTNALLFASKKTGLEINADKTKYMVLLQDQNAGWNHNIKIDNKSFGRVEQLKYLVTTLKIKIKFRKKSIAGWSQVTLSTI